MSHPLLPLRFPDASDSTLAGMALTFVALIGGAISWEYARKRIRRRRNRESDWKMVRELLREKTLDEGQEKLVAEMLEKYASNAPLAAVTVRQQFDALAERQMRDVLKEKDEKKFQAMGTWLYDIRLRLGLDFVPYGRNIMSTRELRTGQVLWLHPATGSSEWIMGSVSSTDEAYFGVTLKETSEGRLVPGATVSFRLWREDDGRYHFDTPQAVTDRTPRVLLFYHTSKLTRVQERCHYRIRCNIDTKFERYDENSKISLNEAPRYLPINICSLSAGGFAAIINQAVPRGILVRIPLNLPGESPFEIEAKMIGSNAVGGGRHIARGQFLGAYQEAQDIIARYIARRQQVAADDPLAMER